MVQFAQREGRGEKTNAGNQEALVQGRKRQVEEELTERWLGSSSSSRGRVLVWRQRGLEQVAPAARVAEPR